MRLEGTSLRCIIDWTMALDTLYNIWRTYAVAYPVLPWPVDCNISLHPIIRDIAICSTRDALFLSPERLSLHGT